LNGLLALGPLFLSSFFAATLLPGGSEWVLAGVLAAGAAGMWPALAVATIGNTLGGLTSWLIGRIAPNRATNGRALQWVRRWGAPVLLLSWLPLIGDALCVAAGWMRLDVWESALFMAIGKFARYYVIAGLMK
jgi:membrane protein YqaA with SNARE-associated domain